MSFEVAAEAYDRFMGRFARPLSPQMADLAGVRPGMSALDVGCGTGALTELLVERLGAANVAGVDPSAAFVAAIRERLPGVRIEHGSAEDLPFEDGAFDVALAQLVVHFMTDAVEGIREMARVTRPGGVVAACVWDHAGGTGPVSLFWEAARALGRPIHDESDLPGARAGHLTELFEAAGLGDVHESVIAADLAMATFDEYLEPFTRGVGPAGAFFAALDADEQAVITAAARRLAGAEPFTVTARAWVARGVAGPPA